MHVFVKLDTIIAKTQLMCARNTLTDTTEPEATYCPNKGQQPNQNQLCDRWPYNVS